MLILINETCDSPACVCSDRQGRHKSQVEGLLQQVLLCLWQRETSQTHICSFYHQPSDGESKRLADDFDSSQEVRL